MQRSYLQQRGDQLENLLKAEIEGLAFVLAPKNKPAVIKTLMRRMKTGCNHSRGRLSRSYSRHGTQAFADRREHGSCAALDEIAESKIGEVKINDLNDGQNRSKARRQRFHRQSLRRAGSEV